MDYDKVVAYIESKKYKRGYIQRTKATMSFILETLREQGAKYLSIREISDTVRIYESQLQKIMADLLETEVVERTGIKDDKCKKNPVYGYRLNTGTIKKIMTS